MGKLDGRRRSCRSGLHPSSESQGSLSVLWAVALMSKARLDHDLRHAESKVPFSVQTSFLGLGFTAGLLCFRGWRREEKVDKVRKAFLKPRKTSASLCMIARRRRLTLALSPSIFVQAAGSNRTDATGLSSFPNHEQTPG